MLEDGMGILYHLRPIVDMMNEEYSTDSSKHVKPEAQRRKAIARRRKRNKNKKTHRK